MERSLWCTVRESWAECGSETVVGLETFGPLHFLSFFFSFHFCFFSCCERVPSEGVTHCRRFRRRDITDLRGQVSRKAKRNTRFKTIDEVLFGMPDEPLCSFISVTWEGNERVMASESLAMKKSPDKALKVGG